jgi:hypothetical protein
MTEETENYENEDFQLDDELEEAMQVEEPSAEEEELRLLKERADVMGLKYHPAIGLKKLKAKIEEHKKEVANAKRRETMKNKQQAAGLTAAQITTAPRAPVETPQLAAQLQQYDEAANGITSRTKSGNRPVISSQNARRMLIHKKANTLVRIRVTCMNPNKSKLPGEIFSVGNSSIGFIKKYVPFNAENGWHVPQIILTQIQNRKFTTFYEVDIGGKKTKRHKLIPEFSVEIMTPLTGQQLKELAQRQRMAAGKES